MIFHPDIRLTMLKQHRTLEGENFVEMSPLQVEVPSVMGGSITIVHKMDAQSPINLALAAAKEDCGPDSSVMQSIAISVTIVANDTVYNGEVNSMKRYKADDMRYNQRFVDVMHADSEGKFSIDFEKFHDTKPIPKYDRKHVAKTTKAVTSVHMCM